MALEFNGTTQYVTVPDAADLSFGDESDDSPFSCVGWMNIVDDAAIDSLISKWDAGNAKREWIWRIKADDKLDLVLRDETGVWAPSRTTNAAIPMGSLIHVVSTYDGRGGATAANGMAHYINGALIASTANNNVNYVAMHPDTADVVIGSRVDHDWLLNGIGFDFRIYNRVLSLAEIETIYYAQGADNIVNGLIARWLMNEKPDGQVAAGANVVIDISGNSHHGTPANNPIYRGASTKLVKPII